MDQAERRWTHHLDQLDPLPLPLQNCRADVLVRSLQLFLLSSWLDPGTPQRLVKRPSLQSNRTRPRVGLLAVGNAIWSLILKSNPQRGQLTSRVKPNSRPLSYHRYCCL
jgi:hypothetical protein